MGIVTVKDLRSDTVQFESKANRGEYMIHKTVGRGEPLVLIHGLGQTHHAWMHQEKLADQFQLFMPTLRGHGSTFATEPIKLSHFATDILRLLDEYDISSAHFCGISLGGVIAQEIHRLAPSRVRSMVLANTTSYVPSISAEYAIRERIRLLDKYSDESYIEDTVLNCLYRPNPIMCIEAAQTFQLNRDTYIASARSIKGIDYLSDLKTNTPIHLIASSHDRITPYLFNAHVTKWYAKKAKMTILNQTGHLSNIEKPEQFNQIIREFIEKAR